MAAPMKTRFQAYAEGGEHRGHTEIIAAGGEYVIPPEIVRRIGHGDIEHGCDILDHMVRHIRDEHIETLQDLPEPKK
jgi:hypothetical protein